MSRTECKRSKLVLVSAVWRPFSLFLWCLPCMGKWACVEIEGQPVKSVLPLKSGPAVELKLLCLASAFTCCLRCLLLWGNTMTKSRLGRKGLISPASPASSPSLMEFKARTFRQELKQKPWGITARWLALLWIAGPAFLEHPDYQPTSSAAHIDWALSYLSSIEWVFSVAVSSFQKMLVSVRLT